MARIHTTTLPSIALCGALALAPLQSHALNILLTNDDGVTANIKALQSALTAAGHDVVVSVPCQNQSGQGAAIKVLTPITPVTSACVGGAAQAGDPGIGAVDDATGLTDAYYVNSTPVTALLYGLDVLAPDRWSTAPDLVISGPNEGQNLGGLVISSGTISNAQFAVHAGVPAIAVSADGNTKDNDVLAAEVAALTLQLVEKLENHKGNFGLLPDGYSLNVNYPTFEAGASSALPWAITRFGNFDVYELRVVETLAEDPLASQVLPEAYLDFPGLTVNIKTAADATHDTDPNSEALVNLNGNITITPMQFSYEVQHGAGKLLGYLKSSLNK